MRLLALDAATENCSVALSLDGRLIERVSEVGKAYAEQLLSMVAEVLAEGAVALRDLDGMAASVGPGGFTGVRVSVSVAQGLAFGADLRVVPISTLEALAFRALSDSAQSTPRHALACLDARMQEVYWGCYAADPKRGVIPTLPARVSAAGVVAPPPTPHLGIGRGFSAYPDLKSLPGVVLAAGADAALPSAREFARLGLLRFSENLDPAELQPVYLRDKVADTEAERAARRVI